MFGCAHGRRDREHVNSALASTQNQTEGLAAFASGLRYEDLPAPVVTRAREVILDTLAAVISGTRLEPGEALVAYGDTMVSDEGGVAVPGTRLRLAPTDAALVISGLAHADETDDAHTATGTHPGCVTVGGALAASSGQTISGRDFICAVVAGYDVECRISRAMDTMDTRKRGFSTLGICGTFGAAAASARSLRSTPGQMIGTLGLAGLQAAGLNAYHQDETHFAKALQVGFASRSGVASTLLARLRPVPPIQRVLDGRNNVVAAFSTSPNYGALTDGLGERYEILGTSLKAHACGGPVRWAVDALLDLIAAEGFAPADIESIDVEVAHSSVELVGPHATVPAISLAYVLAVAAFDGCVGIEQTHSKAKISNPDILALRDRVKLHGNDSLQDLYPALQPAIVTVRLVDGHEVSRRVDHALGSAERPMSTDQVEQKFRRLCEPVIGLDETESVIEAVRVVELAADVGEALGVKA